MTFEYRDEHRQTLRVTCLEPDYPGQTVAPAIWIETSDGFFGRTAVLVPLDRVEEVIAGIRDTARTASGQTTHAAPHPDSGLTACCRKTPFELPHTDLMTTKPETVTCRQVAGQPADAGGPDPCSGCRYVPCGSCPTVAPAAGQPVCIHPDGYEGECPCATGCGCCKVEPAPPAEDRVTVYGIGINEWDGMQLALRRIEAALTGQPATQQQTDDDDQLVHVGWWCWRGNNHGHLATQACKSDNVPLHAPAEWADDMRAVIQRIEDGDNEPATQQTDRARTVDPTAAIEIWARLLCAADVHVNDGDHPTWQQLSTTPGRGQDEYRKAARWLLPRMTVDRCSGVERAAGLREAADEIERRQNQLDAEIHAEYGELDRDTEIEGAATRAMAARLRRMAGKDER